ncbi:MAG: type I restriction endonuclease subunit R [Bacteroidales bacterium]|nr:type I restriction endonuclease subunit R [Candidatus Colicola caccequi]
MANRYTEELFETYFVEQLLANGYLQRNPEDYDRKDAMLKWDLIDFIKDTQPEEYQKLVTETGSEQLAQRSIFARIRSELKGGTLNVLRNPQFEAGFGCRFQLIYYKPTNKLSPQAWENYGHNRVAVVRQLRYSIRDEHAGNEIDLTLFVNGFPVATIELKNHQTGQTYMNAIKQYMKDRRADGEPLLEFKRCLVHFAMGTEQVYMTTKLDGDKTRFFPFNKTCQNEGVISNTYRTSYMWEDVLQRDSLMELIQSFVNVNTIEETVYDERIRQFVKKEHEVMIFPRWHQRRAVRSIVEDAKQRGVGHRYLIQHSAGSGKSNTISWLAYALSTLHLTASSNEKIFDTILVVTDRRVLDRQLQNNLRQFDEHKQLYCIDSKKNMTSKDLQEAIETGKQIIVTTLQKFSVISDTIKHFQNRTFAVLIDEAHSSQTGQAARDMRKALSLEEAARFDAELMEGTDLIEDAALYEEQQDMLTNQRVATDIRLMSNKRNVSFFAFTATPKAKTIEMFCEIIDGQKRPFDTYSTEQAVREGFIRDVLEDYTSYKRYYKLVQRKGVEDKEYEKKKAVSILAEYVDSLPETIEMRARIMLRHFMEDTEAKIQGRARAMVVTRSRLHAVRYKRAFDTIMREANLPYQALVAFSGTVFDEETGMEYTESNMNNLEKNIDIPLAFKLPKYRILIVAEKYQTGFDEPLLHTMYVDKKLTSVSAVQTLSRLNRTCEGKDGTCIIDMVNDPKEIQQAFQDYYGQNYIPEDELTDPNGLYDLKSKVEQYHAFTKDDVNAFARIYFDPKSDPTKALPILDHLCDEIKTNLSQEEIDELRQICNKFVRFYRFVFQIITFKDVELEKLYVFLAALVKQLPYERTELPYEVLREAELDNYKLQFQYQANLSLTKAEDTSLSGQKPGGVSQETLEEIDWLSNIIKTLNDEFGIDLTEQDKRDLEMLRGRIYSNQELLGYFNDSNSRENIQDKFNEEVDNELLDFINDKLELYNKLTDEQVSHRFKRAWFDEIYGRLVSGLRG